MREAAARTILVVDDVPANVALLQRMLRPLDYRVVVAVNGEDALERVAAEQPDLVLTDIVMPIMDGFALCRHLRSDPATRLLPVIMLTGSGEQEKLKAIEAGADDFVPKPFHQAELLARIKSLLRVKTYQDQIQVQAGVLAEQAHELAELNQTLEDRVKQQLAELERLHQLRRFLSPQLAELVMSSGGEALLQSHRREIAVVFTDLRGFSGFAETSEPEEIMHVLHEYHAVLGTEVARYGGTVGFFAGDGLMVFFNDPVPCEDPATRAVRMATAMRTGMAPLISTWRHREINLGFGAGIALG
ncbi:MAG: adenylate cyclase, partial [Chloroflexota bacterium]|nr:adenylate cyclase [Chloroflexota bacterium]